MISRNTFCYYILRLDDSHWLLGPCMDSRRELVEGEIACQHRGGGSALSVQEEKERNGCETVSTCVRQEKHTEEEEKRGGGTGGLKLLSYGIKI